MNNSQIIQTLASTNPDFARFQAEHSSLTTQTEVPEDLLEKTLSFLENDPEQAAVITTLRDSSSIPKSFIVSEGVFLFVAVAFLMRTHIKLERKTGENGEAQWQFLLEHQPSDNKLIAELFKKMEAWGGD